MFIEHNRFRYDVKCPKCSGVINKFSYESFGRFSKEFETGWQALVQCVCQSCNLEFFISASREDMSE
jgi:hypothetical protein